MEGLLAKNQVVLLRRAPNLAADVDADIVANPIIMPTSWNQLSPYEKTCIPAILGNATHSVTAMDKRSNLISSHFI